MSNLAFAVFLFGLIFGAGPCFLSCGPWFIAYTVGTDKGPRRAVISYILFSLSRLLAYLLVSAAVFFFGRVAAQEIIGGYRRFLMAGAGLLICFIGITLIFGNIRWAKFRGFNLAGAYLEENNTKVVFLAGIFFGLLPCAPFLAAVSYIGLVSRNLSLSLFYALCFWAGTFFSPLVLFMLLSVVLHRSLLVLNQNNRVYRRLVRLAAGSILIFSGLHLAVKNA